MDRLQSEVPRYARDDALPARRRAAKVVRLYSAVSMPVGPFLAAIRGVLAVHA